MCPPGEQTLDFPPPAQGRSSAQTSAEHSSKVPYRRNCDYPLWETPTHSRGPDNTALTFSCSCYSHNHKGKTRNTAVGYSQKRR